MEFKLRKSFNENKTSESLTNFIMNCFRYLTVFELHKILERGVFQTSPSLEIMLRQWEKLNKHKKLFPIFFINSAIFKLLYIICKT